MEQSRLDAAQKAIASTLRKEEKALITMTAKEAKQWQLDRLAESIRHHRAMLALVEQEEVCREGLESALAAIPGYIAGIEKILPKFQLGTPQHTLAVRRIDAYRAAEELGRQKLEEHTCC